MPKSLYINVELIGIVRIRRRIFAKMNQVAIFALVLLCLAVPLSGRSGGAPAGACDSLTPSPSAHGMTLQDRDVPYSVNHSALPFITDVGYGYEPGETYTLSIGPNAGATGLDAMFRGTLIQTRPLGNDDMMVGTFAVIDDVNSRLSSCTPPEAGFTHNNGNDKDVLYFMWTAPSNGTGAVRFRFAVVQMQPVFWADQSGPNIYELGPDLMPVMNQMLPPATDPPATAGAVTVVTGFALLLVSTIAAVLL